MARHLFRNAPLLGGSTASKPKCLYVGNLLTGASQASVEQYVIHRMVV